MGNINKNVGAIRKITNYPECNTERATNIGLAYSEPKKSGQTSLKRGPGVSNLPTIQKQKL